MKLRWQTGSNKHRISFSCKFTAAVTINFSLDACKTRFCASKNLSLLFKQPKLECSVIDFKITHQHFIRTRKNKRLAEVCYRVRKLKLDVHRSIHQRVYYSFNKLCLVKSKFRAASCATSRLTISKLVSNIRKGFYLGIYA